MTDPTNAALGPDTAGRGFRRFASAAERMHSGRDLPTALKIPETRLLEQRPEPAFATVERPGSPFLPIQSKLIDRSPSARNPDKTPLMYNTLGPDQTFEDLDGTRKIVRFSRFGSYGLDPYDPCRPFSLAIPFGAAICPTLAPYAAARCGF